MVKNKEINTNEQIFDLAAILTNKLLNEGFIVQRYDEVGKCSVYLKLDYGVSNSIRISDHEGKPYLLHRYNIGSWIQKRRLEEIQKYPQWFFPVVDVQFLMKQVKEHRLSQLRKFGKENYRRYMNRNKEMNDSSLWRNALTIVPSPFFLNIYEDDELSGMERYL